MSPAHEKHTMAVRAAKNNPVALGILSAMGGTHEILKSNSTWLVQWLS